MIIDEDNYTDISACLILLTELEPRRLQINEVNEVRGLVLKGCVEGHNGTYMHKFYYTYTYRPRGSAGLSNRIQNVNDVHHTDPIDAVVEQHASLES